MIGPHQALLRRVAVSPTLRNAIFCHEILLLSKSQDIACYLISNSYIYALL